MDKLNEIKQNKLDSAEFTEKLKNLGAELRSELGDEFIDKLENIIRKRVDYFAYAYILCSLLVLLIFVFFGYKLYKSLAERERRKEEKRRQKQQKKKK